MLAQTIEKYRAPFALIWRYGRERKKLLGGFIVLAVFGALTESFGVFLLVPLLETMGKNNIFANTPLLGGISQFFDGLPSETRLAWAGGLMLVVVLVRGVLQFVQEYIGYAIPHRIDFNLRLKAYAQMLKANIRFADALGAGELSNFTVGHPARIGIALRFVATLIASIFVLLSYILVLFIIAPMMCLAAIVYVIVATLIYRKLTTNIVHKVGRDTTTASEAFAQLFYETLNGAKLIRLAGATSMIKGRVADTVGQLERTKDRTVAVENMTVPIFSVMGGMLICAMVISVGFLDPATAARTVGVLVIFIVLLFRILAPLSIINISRNNIIIHLDALSEYDRLFRLSQKAEDKNGDLAINRFENNIRLENVSFAYDEAGPDALHSFDLDIPKGQMVAIVGSSGSGKSTLINLLARLYRPDKGRILIDGIDLNDLEIESWWRRLSVVTQETMLINDTIQANISFGMQDMVTKDQIISAAQKASLHDWIDTLPEGYDTVLADRGNNLSGGQRQRLILARAFVRDPDILILDEATSALDSLTGKAIQQQILAMKGKKTLIVIAHQLSTVLRADTILVLDQGQIVEHGTHQELLDQHGIYWQMIEQQSLAIADDETSSPVPAD